MTNIVKRNNHVFIKDKIKSILSNSVLLKFYMHGKLGMLGASGLITHFRKNTGILITFSSWLYMTLRVSAYVLMLGAVSAITVHMTCT